jgi:hypothetical protein
MTPNTSEETALTEGKKKSLAWLKNLRTWFPKAFIAIFKTNRHLKKKKDFLNRPNKQPTPKSMVIL